MLSAHLQYYHQLIMKPMTELAWGMTSYGRRRRLLRRLGSNTVNGLAWKLPGTIDSPEVALDRAGLTDLNM